MCWTFWTLTLESVVLEGLNSAGFVTSCNLFDKNETLVWTLCVTSKLIDQLKYKNALSFGHQILYSNSEVTMDVWLTVKLFSIECIIVSYSHEFGLFSLSHTFVLLYYNNHPRIIEWNIIIKSTSYRKNNNYLFTDFTSAIVYFPYFFFFLSFLFTNSFNVLCLLLRGFFFIFLIPSLLPSNRRVMYFWIIWSHEQQRMLFFWVNHSRSVSLCIGFNNLFFFSLFIIDTAGWKICFSNELIGREW